MDGELREAIARIIDPEAWEEYLLEDGRVDQEVASIFQDAYEESLAKSDNVLGLIEAAWNTRLQALEGAWQPIETAPKDGPVIHVWAPGFEWPEAVRWEPFDPHTAAEVGEVGYWTYAEELLAEATDSCEPEQWTHWMPLPEPPQ